MWSDFISLIFPQNCINCQQSLISEEKFLCTICKIDLPYTNDHKNPENELFRKFVFEKRVQTAASYLYFYQGGVAQKLLHELKYKEKKGIASLLGSWYARDLSDLDVDLIIPVPLHKSKLRKRGFNQSDIFAEGINSILEVEVEKHLVSRTVATMTQTKKKKVDRWTNLENVYSEVKANLSDISVLVVDDVITTGATIGMLCERLVQADVKSIHIASIARGK